MNVHQLMLLASWSASPPRLNARWTSASLGLQTIVAEANDGFVNVEMLKGVNIHAIKPAPL